MIFGKIDKMKRADLEVELDLYREAGTEGVAASESLANVKAVIEEITRLQAEVGYPVKLTDEFVNGNPVLGAYLIENGANIGDIVFAEDADLEEVAKIEAQIQATKEAEKKAAEANNATTSSNQGTSAPAEVDLVFNGKTVINVVDALVHGKSVKDVYVATGECFRMSPEDYTKNVTPRTV